ncbi:MAG: hypothetical protein QM767_24325 [Anaeromyxobacter sp.]
MRPAPLAAALAALAFLLHAGGAAAQEEEPYEPTGEVRFFGWSTGAGATFDVRRVVGPNVNLSRRDNGSWAGDLAGMNVDLEVVGDRIRGSNVSLQVTKKKTLIHVEGLFFGARVNLELEPKRFHGRFGACSLDLDRKNMEPYHGNVGCQRVNMATPQTARASLQLFGDAGAAEPPLMQLAFALLAVLPG